MAKINTKNLFIPNESRGKRQEFFLSQHKIFKRSPDNELAKPDFNQEQDAWQINVPRNSDCLFIAAALSYLIPVRNNPSDFQDRFDKLFLEKAQEAIDKDELKQLIQKYNPFLDDKIYVDKTLKELVQRFRKKAVQFIRDNQSNSKFQNRLGSNPENYLSKMENTDTWGTDIEIEAISGLLGCKFKIFSKTSSYDISFYSYRGDMEILQLKLFYDTTAAGGSRDGHYYSFSIEKHIGDEYRKQFYVNEGLRLFIKTFTDHFKYKLTSIHKEVGPEGKTEKTGKVAAIISQYTKALSEIPVVGKPLGQTLGKGPEWLGKRNHRKKAKAKIGRAHV